MQTYNNLTIQDLESLRIDLWTKSLSVTVCHSHGYHGSDKDCCSYCGSLDPENKKCNKGTDKRRNYLIKKVEEISKTLQILDALPSRDVDHLLKYISISVDTSYENL